MKNIYSCIIAFGLLMLIVIPSVSAESLFDPRGASLFKDHRARMVGDVVTIIVTESTTAQNEGTSDFQKKIGMSGGVRVEGFLDYLFPGIFEPMEPIKKIDIDPTEKFGGSGKTSEGNKFSTRISATVIEVLPNENLVVEGSRMIKVNEENQELVFKGVVRPEDVSPLNTVMSAQVADVQIFYKGKGPVAQRNKPGLITKIFNWIF
jgi:flagellar L-ring protein FlgH